MKKRIDVEARTARAEPGLEVPGSGLGFFGQEAESEVCASGGDGAPSPSLASGEAKRALGWYSRGYLPHFDAIGALQFVTFRLADSLPGEALRRLRREVAVVPPERREREYARRVERLLDSGLGCCALRHPRMAAVMRDTLLKSDPERYRLMAWCVMPNHVHVLIEARCSLPKIVQSWKSYTGRWAFAHSAELGLGAPVAELGPGAPGLGGRFWQREYWDRSIRDEAHYARVVAYIHDNPAHAGLCAGAADWCWSSAAC